MTSYTCTHRTETAFYDPDQTKYPGYWFTVSRDDGQFETETTWRAWRGKALAPDGLREFGHGRTELGWWDAIREALSAIQEDHDKVSVRPLDNPFQSCPAPATCEECDNPKPHSGHGDPREEDVEFSAPSQCSVEPSF